MILCTLLYMFFFMYDRSLILKCASSTQKRLKNICIISFILIEGLRYGRGRDYFHYGNLYLHYKTEGSHQPLYQLFQSILHEIDFTLSFLPYGALFIAISTLFIICFFKFGKLFEKHSKYFFILGILATQYIFEWTIRQGMSFALILVSLYFFENKSNKKALLFIVLGLCMHYGNIFYVLVISLCYYLFSQRPISLKISLPLLFFGTFLSDASSTLPYVQIFVSNLNLSFLGEGFSHYTTDINRWFSETSILEDMQRGILTTIITTLFYASIIIIGYYNHKKYNRWVYLYNACVISLLIYVPFYLIEIISRIVFPATVLWFIPVALCFHNIPYKQAPMFLRISYITLIIYLFAYYGRFVFFNPIGSYVWSQQPIINYL